MFFNVSADKPLNDFYLPLQLKLYYCGIQQRKIQDNVNYGTCLYEHQGHLKAINFK